MALNLDNPISLLPKNRVTTPENPWFPLVPLVNSLGSLGSLGRFPLSKPISAHAMTGCSALHPGGCPSAVAFPARAGALQRQLRVSWPPGSLLLFPLLGGCKL